MTICFYPFCADREYNIKPHADMNVDITYGSEVFEWISLMSCVTSEKGHFNKYAKLIERVSHSCKCNLFGLFAQLYRVKFS